MVQDFESGIFTEGRREELFERERHSEPVAGWHSCATTTLADSKGKEQTPQR